MNANRNEALGYWWAAQRDKIAFEILAASVRAPIEHLCFDAQQYLEKLLKTALTLRGIAFPRTHDVIKLAGSIAAIGGSLPVSFELLDKLGPCSVLARYEGNPDLDISRDELVAVVDQASQWAEQLRETHALP